MSNRSIVLTGFMGTGKSLVGRLLASRLGWDFVDTDAEIERRHGPVTEIFRSHGEQAFRLREREVALELANTPLTVIATGGGMLLDPETAAAFEKHALVVCLSATPQTIASRLDGQADRPLLEGDDRLRRIEDLLAARAEAYAAYPQVATDGVDPEQVVDAILELRSHTD